MAIEFFCPGCGKMVRTPDEMAGRKGRCPTCQLKVQIPDVSLAGAEVVPETHEPTAGEIRFRCGGCSRELSVPRSGAGTRGKCPHCGVTLELPVDVDPAPHAASDYPERQAGGMVDVLVSIPIEGDWPSEADLTARNRIIDELNRVGIGDFTGSGGERGSMEFGYRVEDAARARATIEYSVRRHLPNRPFTVTP